MTKKTVLSAVQPNRKIHLGNYLGAIRNWVDLQADYDCLFFAVDLHTTTVRMDHPQELKDLTYRTLATYLAAGISPEHATLFVQSHVPEHAELAWALICHTYMGELNRMTQFKDKSSTAGTNIGAGLFTYPCLMAADILLYQTHIVPVGQDQKQHIELTRDLAERFNSIYGPTFVVPEAKIFESGARIMSLQNPTQKMSKSDADVNASIYLEDSSDTVLKKLKRAVTDSKGEIRMDRNEQPGVSNLLDIQSALLGKSTEELVSSYLGKQYGHLKIETAEIINATLEPIRNRVQQWMSNREELDQILSKGASKARDRAQKTMTQVYSRLGYIPRF